MKKDIILCGVGGDGIVSVAKIISDAALSIGLNVKQSEIHGMSQRGGSVFSHLRVSSEPISADVIPEGKADIILSSEPMEALRYLPFLGKDGVVITNSAPFVNIKNYPDINIVMEELHKLPRCVAFDANDIAKKVNARSNMVLLGAAAPYMDIDFQRLEDAITRIFNRKGEAVVKSNIDAIRAGRDAK
ncbi:MAG: indolepyruvate oxidoreductase subunit beta [Bacteroidales bacterium]|nr:indolepyruvate oxidoreductase subunit beta [Bacteroidales bacterium]